MRQAFLFITFSVSIISLFAQQSKDLGLMPKEEVFFDASESPYVLWQMNKGQSLYKASKIYDVAVSKIMQYNRIEDPNNIEEGSTIKIPIDLASLFTAIQLTGEKHTKFIPLYYTVKPKETLYRISKIYAKQSVADMMERNNLSNNVLEIGDELILGWLPLDSKSVQHYSILPLNESKDMTMINNKVTEESLVLDNIDSTDMNTVDIADMDKLKQEKGIAIWNKGSKGQSRYALHPTARINSEIELYNPLVRRTVKAKVIGRIPEGAYREDISVILSPATAVSLGALDSRFKVIMKYKE